MRTKIKQILQYIVGVLLLICSLPMFSEGSKGIIGGIVLIVGGLICVPKTRQIIEQKYKFQFSKPVKYIIVIFAWFSIGIFSKPIPPEIKNETSPSTLPSPKLSQNNVPLSTDTIIQKDNKAITKNETKLKEIKKNPLKVKSNNSSISSFKATSKNNSKITKKKKSGYGNSYTSGRSGYIRGPRGGCYYINSNGKKVYVDHSYCN